MKPATSSVVLSVDGGWTAFGDAGDIPVCGDWTGVGHDTPGLFRNGIFYLRNSLTSGGADIAFGYGSPGDIPIILRDDRIARV